MIFGSERVWNFVPTFSVLSGIFDAEQCAAIVALHGQAPESRAVAKNGEVSYRNTDLFWLDGSAPAYRWIFERLRDVTLKFNAETYQFEIDACSDLQLARYTENQHYDWHLDLGPHGYSRRKISISVMLTDPATY